MRELIPEERFDAPILDAPILGAVAGRPVSLWACTNASPPAAIRACDWFRDVKLAWGSTLIPFDSPAASDT
jgi:hypothetical protein